MKHKLCLWLAGLVCMSVLLTACSAEKTLAESVHAEQWVSIASVETFECPGEPGSSLSLDGLPLWQLCDWLEEVTVRSVHTENAMPIPCFQLILLTADESTVFFTVGQDGTVVLLDDGEPSRWSTGGAELYEQILSALQNG